MNKQILAPGIILYKTDQDKVKEILDLVEPVLTNRWKPAMGVNTDTYSDEVVSSRSCYDCPLSENETSQEAENLYQLTHNWIQPTIDDFVSEYSVENIEKGSYIFLKYNYNDKFDWHIDDGKKYPRTVSVSAYLNDNYEGGELEFKHFGISYKPVAGDIVVFCSAFPYLHRVNPVSSGTRYAVVNWYRYAGYPAVMD